MKKKQKAVPKIDPYIEGLMAKLLERLVSIEKKIDAAVSQAPGASQPPRHDRVLYEAICADCSKVCEVPFKPTEERPVYCKQCWARRKSGRVSRPGMPVLTPVSLPPKLASKLSAAAQAKKVPPAKKPKKKK